MTGKDRPRRKGQGGGTSQIKVRKYGLVRIVNCESFSLIVWQNDIFSISYMGYVLQT